MSGHYTTLELVDYARGYLTGDEARDLFAHCQRCDECGGRLAAVLALRTADSRRRSRARRRKVLSTAASITCAALIGFGGAALWDEYRKAPEETEAAAIVDPAGDVVAAPAADDGGGAGSVVEAASTYGRAGAPQLTPELAELAALATTELPNPFFLQLRLGPLAVDLDYRELRVRAVVRDLWEGHIDDAVPALENLYRVNPADAEVAAYLGIARYMSGDRHDDVDDLLNLGATTTWDSLQDIALWYLANHRLRNGDPVGCADILAELAVFETRTGLAARSLLDKLPARYRRDNR